MIDVVEDYTPDPPSEPQSQRPGQLVTQYLDSPAPLKIEALSPLPTSPTLDRFIAFLDEKAQGSEAGGIITVEFDGPPVGHVWEIERLIVSSNSAAATELRIYFDKVDLRNLVTGSSTGNFDTTTESPPLRLFDSRPLIFRWTNAPSAGSIGFARIIGKVVKR